MKKTFVSTILVLVLLATAGIVYAAWEDTQTTQVTATILPLPGGMFQIVSSNCNNAVFGYSSDCFVTIESMSATIMSIDVITITTGHPYVSISNVYGVGNSVEPGQQSSVSWNYHHNSVDPAEEGGPAIFDVEITCSGD